MIPAPRNNPDFNSHEWQDWFFQVWKAIGGSGGGSEMFSTTLINNQYSKANYTCGNTYYSTMGHLSSLSGSITSGVEENVLSVTGKGAYHYLAIRKTSGLTCTATVRLNIDGVLRSSFLNYKQWVIVKGWYSVIREMIDDSSSKE